MSDWSRVTVRVDEDGNVVGVNVEGEIDRDNLTEERPETPPLPEDPDERAGRSGPWADRPEPLD